MSEKTVDTAALEAEIREALRDVVDPELGMNVVDLGLIRKIEFKPDETEITMILTTPFCPIAGWLINQVKERAEQVVGGAVKVTLGDEMWDPSMMEVDSWGLV